MAAGRLFLGVDGGQSSTKAVIGDATGRVLARAVGGPCNHAAQGEGEAKLRKAVSGVVRDALAAAGLPTSAVFAAACLGMSGGPDDKREILAEIVPADSLNTVTDAEVALEGAAADGPVVIVIAGTGAMALAKHGDGRSTRCGGWGYVFGDEGSAFDIVRQALQRCLAWEEGWGVPTALSGVLLDATGSASLREALHCFYRPDWPRDRIASLAPKVDATATRGDQCAREILGNAGLALAALASRAIRSADCAGLHWDVYCSGGVFRSASVRDVFEERCSAAGYRVQAPAHDAAIGALLLAYRAAGLNPTIRDLA